MHTFINISSWEKAETFDERIIVFNAFLLICPGFELDLALIVLRLPVWKQDSVL